MLRAWTKRIPSTRWLLLLLIFGCGCEIKDADTGKDAGELEPGGRSAQTDERDPPLQNGYDPAAWPLSSHLNEKCTEDLDGLVEKRYIRVLATFSKTNFFISDSGIYGFEYSLLKDYEESLNRGIGRRELQVVLEFIPVPYDQLIPRLVEGYGDIAAAGLTITPEREKQVAFTNPYLTHVDELVVTNRKTQELKTLEDLSGCNVYVRKSSSYYESLVSLNGKLAETGIPPVHILKVDESLQTEDIFEMVHSGAIPITIANSNLAEIWSSVFDNLQVHSDLKVRTGSRIAWMVRKDNPKLRESLNKFIRGHRKGTLLGNIYFERYFEHNKWIKNPLTKRTLKRHRQYTELFKKYATQYGFDWRLIMAMAYQESRLDNNKKSPTGAVGIMQVRPSTAADGSINIRDVHLLENNVHAGVKYLAFLRDRYFQEDRIDKRNRIRFSLAAYNAGPQKIRRAQRLAQEMKLDPYQWFRNVEMATLRIVGQETVQYVSNINKYYVLFKLYEDTEKLRESSKQGPLARDESY
ncbi:MAG: transglycosylase SLT domain-containing protein [Thermodesulfobacteriota bacterium]